MKRQPQSSNGNTSPEKTSLTLALGALEMAEAVGVSQSQLEALARAGRFPNVMLGGRRVFPVDAARLFLSRHALAVVGETIDGAGPAGTTEGSAA